MRKLFPFVIILVVAFAFTASAEKQFETDIIKTSTGDLKITFIGHGTLMFSFGGKIIHVDPVTSEADYTKFPKADMILITHQHRDHF